MHPNSLGALLQSFSLSSPVKADLNPNPLDTHATELTETLLLRTARGPRYAICYGPLVDLLCLKFRAFLTNNATGDFSTGELSLAVREQLQEPADDFQKQPKAYAKGTFVNQKAAFSKLVVELVSLVDEVLPAELRAGVVENEYVHEAGGGGDPVSKADLVFWRNESIQVMVEEASPTAHLEGEVLFRTTDLTSSSPVKTLNDAFKAKDRQVHDLLLKMSALCSARSCRRFVLHDWSHYIIGFLSYIDPEDSTTGFDLLYGPLTPVDSVKYPFAEATTSLFYSHHFFEPELRQYVDTVIVAVEHKRREEARRREKREREAETGGQQTEDEPDRKRPRDSREQSELQKERADQGPQERSGDVRAGAEPGGGVTQAEEAVNALEGINSFNIVWPNGSQADLPRFVRIDPTNISSTSSPSSPSPPTIPSLDPLSSKISHPSCPSSAYASPSAAIAANTESPARTGFQPGVCSISTPPSARSLPPTISLASTEEKPLQLQLDEYVGEGATSAVYRGVCAPGDTSFILKLPLHSNDDDENLRLLNEARLLSTPSLRNFQLTPRLYGTFKPSTSDAEQPVVLLMEDGGDDLQRWTELSCEEKQKLYDNLLLLHREHNIIHGDLTTPGLRPRNIVVEKPASNAAHSHDRTIRLIDFGHASKHACPGESKCWELLEVGRQLFGKAWRPL
ncbi:Proteophosphoglycan ppg4 [Rhodotorula toruloides ATCC 204091]|uniref:Proteophosphoglycan ppg4 n=1 Tax=Rhodotorula toruloides TaxID=5286 RepID=A0A0K3CDF0_RHOTO|nr:Proteophosphoglycan ppg4 [Rhodotorula toruloides ATCC 204091]KAK4333593.1 Proteophosphoglycan ppg4 [Rhodotorula toruloides]PRQ74759.1 Proteophosphoglycan ppg4 [Rhodotorula toruloides]